MDGFYPIIDTNASLPEKKAGIRDLGLPYEKDPSVSAHLLSFLCKASDGSDPVIPDKVLFNGGSMIPQILRDRIIKLLNSGQIKKSMNFQHGILIALLVRELLTMDSLKPVKAFASKVALPVLISSK